jgi:ATP-dependent DNA helicase PIF1
MIIGPQKTQSEEIPTIVCSQIPLIKGWAVTMHKMQGSSIESVEIDIGSSIFERGQTYVGLSRVKSGKGLYIRELKIERIKADEKVKEYYEKEVKSK